jgi:succinate-semialdehyde dehydrogenase/glutarate-semialdehyde dehydrogenase
MDTRRPIAQLEPGRGILIEGPRAGGAVFEVDDPATGQVLTAVANGSAAEARDAVDAAARAMPGWAATAPRERAEILERCFRGMREQAEDLSALIAAESGKSLADARAEVGYAAEFFRWFGEEAVRAKASFTRLRPVARGASSRPDRWAWPRW